jgi:bifunctional DNA-binding transcriptional regulator/antitoxin component of YhaV-PrlF toxin-antitoxin module
MNGDPHIRGPKRVPKNGQIVVPADLLQEVGIRAGTDNVYFVGRTGDGRVLLVLEADAKPKVEQAAREIWGTDNP